MLHTAPTCAVARACSGAVSTWTARDSANRVLGQVSQTLKGLVETYLRAESAAHLFTAYKRQTMDCVNNQPPLVVMHFMRRLHQTELGLLDVVMEHLLASERHADFQKMLERHEATSTLISSEIEEFLATKRYVQPPADEAASPPTAAAAAVAVTGTPAKASKRKTQESDEAPPSTSAAAETRSAAAGVSAAAAKRFKVGFDLFKKTVTTIFFKILAFKVPVSSAPCPSWPGSRSPTPWV